MLATRPVAASHTRTISVAGRTTSACATTAARSLETAVLTTALSAVGASVEVVWQLDTILAVWMGIVWEWIPTASVTLRAGTVQIAVVISMTRVSVSVYFTLGQYLQLY